jgi:flagellar protein FlaJ
MNIITRLSVFVKRVFPEKVLLNLEKRLESTKIALTAEEYVSMALLVSIVLCVVMGIVSAVIRLPLSPILLAPLAGILAFPLITFGLPRYLAQARASELERVLPDALRQMSSTMRAGVSVDAALDDISKSNYGELSKEFERVLTEVKRGRTLESALLALSRRSGSPLYERAFRLIVEGIERGAALANVLEAVSNDIKEIHAIHRERRTATTQQVMFLFAVALFAAPFIIGLTVGVGSIKMGTGSSKTSGLPEGMGTVAMIYTAIQAFTCGLAVGVVRYGKVSKGLAYSIIFVIISTIVFTMAGSMVGGMAKT